MLPPAAEYSATWQIDHVTIYTLSDTGSADGTPISNSVFTNGPVMGYTGGVFTDTCFWSIRGGLPAGAPASAGNVLADPLFVKAPGPALDDANFAELENADFTVGSGSQCPAGSGSSIASVGAVLAAMAAP